MHTFPLAFPDLAWFTGTLRLEFVPFGTSAPVPALTGLVYSADGAATVSVPEYWVGRMLWRRASDLKVVGKASLDAPYWVFLRLRQAVPTGPVVPVPAPVPLPGMVAVYYDIVDVADPQAPASIPNVEGVAYYVGVGPITVSSVADLILRDTRELAKVTRISPERVRVQWDVYSSDVLEDESPLVPEMVPGTPPTRPPVRMRFIVAATRLNVTLVVTTTRSLNPLPEVEVVDGGE